MKNTDYLSEEITWDSTNDPQYPYQSFYNGKELLIRLNDFPAEHLYTLIADRQEVTSFDDWAATWNRAPKAKAIARETSARAFGKVKSINYSARKG